MHRRIALVVALVAVVAAVVASVAGAASHKKAANQKVTVIEKEFSFKLIPAGVLHANRPVTFTVLNKGQIVHNFDVQGMKATPVAGPGSRKVITITFKKPGNYPYVCDVPRHAEQGMSGTLKVVK
jgi:plastocyanin